MNKVNRQMVLRTALCVLFLTGMGASPFSCGKSASTAAAPAPAAATPTPSSLPSKRIFVTSTTYSGNLGGLAGADSKCNARAVAGSLGGNWVAWLGASGVNAIDRITVDGVFHRLVDSNIVFNSIHGLTATMDTLPNYAILYNELGGSAQTYPWTAAAQTGQSGGGNSGCFCGNVACGGGASNGSDWTTAPSSGWQPINGNSQSSAAGWTQYNTVYCNTMGSLICVEQ